MKKQYGSGRQLKRGKDFLEKARSQLSRYLSEKGKVDGRDWRHKVTLRKRRKRIEKRK